ncbi:MAG: VOC family protein [Ignavibacteriae bacterium]|nr:VOC family protein [Ignavibacteriota bacterium]
MKIDAVAVSTTNISNTIKFYTLLGFDFSDANLNDQHIEPKTPDGSARLMIDTAEMIESIIGEYPNSSNHSPFAIRCDSPEEIDMICNKLKDNGFNVLKEPWDAFWNQRYAVIKDPDGYMIDLYCDL